MFEIEFHFTSLLLKFIVIKVWVICVKIAEEKVQSVKKKTKTTCSLVSRHKLHVVYKTVSDSIGYIMGCVFLIYWFIRNFVRSYL